MVQHLALLAATRVVGVGEFEQFDGRAVFHDESDAHPIGWAELRAAWQQGRKEFFYPYGKTYVQTIGEQD